MGILEKFELIESNSAFRAKPFITVRSGSVTFSKHAVECLEYSEFVHLYWDKKGRRFAVKACTINDEEAYEFYVKPKPGEAMLVRISGKMLMDKVFELTQIPRSNNGTRYYGEYIEDEKLLLFDLSAAETIVNKDTMVNKAKN